MKPLFSIIIALCLLVPAAIILVRHLRRMLQGRGCEQCGSGCVGCSGCREGMEGCRGCPRMKK